ncbi:F-box only protein 44-like isoform X1 [Brachyistius frenatus]|uniref:F-box only protein 44-like isoform X1 n=1 Tax=Brachyistius frenatus TaxID=100188 RepID=UPI0037E9A6C7
MKRKAMDDGQSSDSTQTQSPMLELRSAAPLNVDILEQIFLNLPPDQVVCLCRLVCHQWKEVADRQSFWRERCRRERYHLRDASKIPDDWRLFYFLNKKRRNLLTNTRGEDQLNGWEILRNGGDKWAVHGMRIPLPDATIRSNFVTSYGLCIKSQLIDLEKEGYKPSFMDHIQPDIRISDWYSRRPDCGSKYDICVELLNERKQILQTFKPDTVYPDKDDWRQMIHVFQNYGPGVRFIRFTHGGVDLRFWKGWYGIRLTDSCVEICPAITDM